MKAIELEEWTRKDVDNGIRFEGKIKIGTAGVLVLQLVSLRPARMWIGGTLAFDEPLYWRSFQRELRGAVILPCREGTIDVVFRLGEEPSFAPYAAVNCPSRNRDKVMRELQSLRPEPLMLGGFVAEDKAPPAMSLRFETDQHQRQGIVYQRVTVRRLVDPDATPSLEYRSSAETPTEAIELTSLQIGYGTRELTRQEEREAGLARYWIPVADELDPLPAMRGEEPESRPEPILEIVRTDELEIRGMDGGRAVVRLPIYETLGRLSPAKEHRRIEWPTEDRLLKDVPRPIVPEQLKEFVVLYDEAWRMLRHQIREAAEDSGLPNGYISTGSNFPHNQFLWDTAFTSIAAAYGFRSWPATASLDVVYATQFDGGYIHRELDVRDRTPVLYEPDFGPNPPILTFAEWSIAALTGDRLRLKRVYPALKAFHDWVVRNRRQSNGTYWTTGLANGLDNSPSYGNGYPCLTAQMAHDAELLGQIAELLGYEDDAKERKREHEETAAALNEHLWDPSQRIYSASLDEGGHNPNKIVTAFWPLLAGAVPADRTKELAKHLTDPASFWRYHPIPSVSADSPGFVPEGDYWRGSVWAPTNYAAIKGFQRAGERKLAYEAAKKHLKAMNEVLRDTGELWENYCSEKPLKGSASAPSYGWTALGPIALLLETVIGLRPDALNGTLSWEPPELGTYGAANYRLGETTLSAEMKLDPDGWHVHVRTDRSFRLEWRFAHDEREWACKPGHQRFRIAPLSGQDAAI